MEKYAWLLPSLEKAKKKYRETHRDVLNARSKEYYDEHKDDEDFRQKCRERSRQYYQKKKESQNK